MHGEQMQRILGRMWASYTNALRLYADLRQGRQESIQDTAKDPNNPTEAERADGGIRWGSSAIAEGIVENQKFEERKVAMSSQVATVSLLTSILTELQDMNQNLELLVSRGGDEGNLRPGTTDSDRLLG